MWLLSAHICLSHPLVVSSYMARGSQLCLVEGVLLRPVTSYGASQLSGQEKSFWLDWEENSWSQNISQSFTFFWLLLHYKASQLLVSCTMLIEAYGNNSRAWKEMHFVTVYTPVDTEVRFWKLTAVCLQALSSCTFTCNERPLYGDLFPKRNLMWPNTLISSAVIIPL